VNATNKFYVVNLFHHPSMFGHVICCVCIH